MNLDQFLTHTPHYVIVRIINIAPPHHFLRGTQGFAFSNHQTSVGELRSKSDASTLVSAETGDEALG